MYTAVSACIIHKKLFGSVQQCFFGKTTSSIYHCKRQLSTLFLNMNFYCSSSRLLLFQIVFSSSGNKMWAVTPPVSFSV